MQPLANPAYGLWIQLILALAIGAAAIVLGCALCASVARGARSNRTIWQASTVGLLLLVLLEFSGTGPGLVAACRLAVSGTAEEEVTTTAPGEECDATRPSPSEEVATPHIDPPDARPEGSYSDLQWSFPAPAPIGLGLDNLDVAYVPLAIHFRPSGELPVAPLPEERPAGIKVAKPIQPETVEPAPFAVAESTSPSEMPAEVPPAAFPAVFNAPWLGVVWAVVAASLIGWAIWTRIRLWRFRCRHGLPADPEMVWRATRLARRMGMRRQVALIEAHGLKTPVAFGTLRPTIALPIGFGEDFDRPQQDAMLAHELAHLAARDPLWHLLATLACGLLWWHPLVWWSRRRFRAASETVADEACLLVPDGPNVLARCLVRLGRRLARPNPVGSLPIEGSGFRSGLGRRVVRLLSLRPDARRGTLPCRSIALKTTLPVLLVIVAVLCTAWVRPQAALAEGGTPMDVLKTSWHSSLATMALVALIGPTVQPAAADEAADTPNPAATADTLALAEDRDSPRDIEIRPPEGDRPRDRAEGERREGDRPRDRAEGERRDGDRPRDRAEGERRDGDRPRDRAEGERREGDRPREGEGDRAERREGDRPRDREPGERREGDRPREGEAERPREREGERAEPREREGAEHAEAAERREIQERERAERREMEERERAEQREMIQRRRAEVEQHARELMEVRKDLEAQARRIHEEMQGLRDGQDAEARELQAALENVRRQIAEVEKNFEAIRREHAGEAERNAERMMVQARTQELLRMREQLQAHAREIAARLERGELGEEDRQHLRMELEKVRDQMVQAERQMAELRERAERPPERPHAPGPAADIERRMQHLRAAAENLHAAGLHDQAENLMREAEGIARELHERGDRPDRPHEPERPEGPPIERVQHQVDELRGTVEDMHRQMEEMRQHLRELVELQRQKER